MKNKSRYRRILYLMIISQALLTVFVAQWLRSQYGTARERLSGELNTMYVDVQDQLIDTMLFRSYVSPALRGKQDTMVLVEEIDENIRWKGQKGHVTIRMNTRPDSLVRFNDTLKLRRRNDDMLMRSMRLIISHSMDSATGNKKQMINFHITPDTAKFIEHFKQRLANE